MGKEIIEPAIGGNSDDPDSSAEDEHYRYAYHLYRICQRKGVSGADLVALSAEDGWRLVRALYQCSPMRRRRIWQRAYEFHFARGVYDALIVHAERSRDASVAPQCQLFFCIDDREESLRRYFEEQGEEFETFGTAGFFGVDAQFDLFLEKPAPYCPITVHPKHVIRERTTDEGEATARLRSRLRALRIVKDRVMLLGSRGLLRGWFLSLAGIAAFIPLALRILFPRLSLFVASTRRRLLKETVTELEYVREEAAESGSVGPVSGYSIAEIASRVKNLLSEAGLKERFAPLVVFVGHGSSSLNNPYKSAYDCGACGGRPGRWNSRVFALMANNRQVREVLKAEGFEIPDSTVFLGAFHNTASDEIELFDVHLVPPTHADHLARLHEACEKARTKNAFERVRRFAQYKATDARGALSHVEERTYHLAEPRPEYGHATNGICVIGRRKVTRGLFLDRRAFLVSYDPAGDSEGSTLRSILSAVVPVCMGINLEYFFSAVDNEHYGSGTKLPHNISAFLGLMTGYSSDLRTGLPSQMVEIHEPVRLVTVIEGNPESVQRALMPSEGLMRVVTLGWILLACFDPASGEVWYCDKGRFRKYEPQGARLPEIARSEDWVAGQSDHLPFASVCPQ